MPESEKFSEKMKAEVLYKMRNTDALPQSILDPGNAKLNEDMAQDISLWDDIVSCWPVGFQGDLISDSARLERMNGTLDGWRILQSISAEGQKAAKAEAEEKKGLINKITGS